MAKTGPGMVSKTYVKHRGRARWPSWPAAAWLTLPPDLEIAAILQGTASADAGPLMDVDPIVTAQIASMYHQYHVHGASRGGVGLRRAWRPHAAPHLGAASPARAKSASSKCAVAGRPV